MPSADVLFSTEPLERAAFIGRPNRFVVRFRPRTGGRPRLAYMTNPGRLGRTAPFQELLTRLRHGM